jgi:hypothetical protein
LLRKATLLGARDLPKPKNFLKQDQSGILAQIFLLCGKVVAGIFHEGIFIARFGGDVK